MQRDGQRNAEKIVNRARYTISKKRGEDLMSKYSIPGIGPVPRVTEILAKYMGDEEGLRAWRSREPNHAYISRRATNLGSIMHWVISNELSPVPLEMDNSIPLSEWEEDYVSEVSARLNHFKRLRMKFDPTPVLEHVVYIHEPGAECGGQLDFRGNINGQPALADWKGSRRIRPEYRVQLGAYYLGSLREGYKAERGFIVRLQRDEKEVLELDAEELADAGSKFLELARRWHKQNDLRKDDP
jgi:hypothetical protein